MGALLWATCTELQVRIPHQAWPAEPILSKAQAAQNLFPCFPHYKRKVPVNRLSEKATAFTGTKWNLTALIISNCKHSLEIYTTSSVLWFLCTVTSPTPSATYTPPLALILAHRLTWKQTRNGFCFQQLAGRGQEADWLSEWNCGSRRKQLEQHHLPSTGEPHYYLVKQRSLPITG